MSFAGFNTTPSPWGYNWTTESVVKGASVPQQPSPEPQTLADAHMPAALLNTMKREKKPFTYTPGGVNLSEVLNARLQKRMERKKKYSEEQRSYHDDGLPKFDPPKQVIVMPTYNTPLDMYSMENALEMLEAQAELVANDKSLSATLSRNHTYKVENDIDPARGVTQSKAFKVLQIMTDTDKEPISACRSHHLEEIRFTGLRDSKAIPSKFFQTLQKITGTEEDDEGEQQPPRHMQQRPVPQKPPLQQQQQHLLQQSFDYAMNNKTAAASQESGGFSTATLKRPAAFLPIKTSAPGGFRPVQLPFLPNGSSVRRVGNPSDGTDF